MTTSSQCTFCNKTNHSFQNCEDPEINTIINRMETDISEKRTWVEVSKYLTKQPAIHVRLLARKNALDTRIQKAFLNEKLSDIYHFRQKKKRLREFAEVIDWALYAEWELFSIDDFDIHKMDIYLYRYMMHGIDDMDERGIFTQEDRLSFVPYELKRVYDEVSRHIAHTDRYSDFMTIFANYKDSVEKLLIRRLNEDNNQNTPHQHKIVPYMLVRPRVVAGKNQPTCAICYNDLTRLTIVKLKCSHEFCTTCFERQTEISERDRSKLLCGLCRHSVDEIYTENPAIYRKYEKRNITPII